MTDPQANMSALEVRNLSKTFPGQRALDKVDLDLGHGEVHALLGQNGCGKSTLVKILSGYHQPDDGADARVSGEPFELGNSEASHDAGLRFVHQDLGLVLEGDAVENLALGTGYQTLAFNRIDWKRERNEARRMLQALGYDCDVRAPLSNLSVAERTGVAIARAVRGWEKEARVLVLDEVTASLPGPDVRKLFEVIARLKVGGVSILYVTHRLDEVFTIADRVTVLRDGAKVADAQVSQIDEDGLVETIVGKPLLRDHRPNREVVEAGDTVLAVSGLTGARIRDLDFSVRSGEVIGFAGVTGSGREELTDLLYGAADRGGEVTVDGRPIPSHRPSMSVESGMALVPAERMQQAVFPEHSVAENLTVADLSPFWRRGWLSKRAERADVKKWLERFDVRPPRGDVEITSLSGGNQQKVIVARWARRAPRVLLLDEPTQGVDVGAKVEVHHFVDHMAESGAAVVVCSNDTDELQRLCDSVAVLDDGKVAAWLEGDTLTPEHIDQAIYSVGGSHNR